MISLVEGAKRQKTPNEIALNILLIGADCSIYRGLCHTLGILVIQCSGYRLPVSPITITVLVALLVCLAPTTIGGLLPCYRNCRNGPPYSPECHYDFQAGRLKLQVMSMSSCLTKPARLPLATGRQLISSGLTGP